MLFRSKQAVFAAAEYEGPVYLRFGRLAVPTINDENYKFQLGKGVTLREGKDVSIIATGLMVSRALEGLLFPILELLPSQLHKELLE